MAKTTDKVRVRIQATQRVRYDQVIEMTRAEYAELKAMEDNLNDRTLECEHRSPLGDWLDLRDCDAAGGFEDIEIRIDKPKKKKAVA